MLRFLQAGAAEVKLEDEDHEVDESLSLYGLTLADVVALEITVQQ